MNRRIAVDYACREGMCMQFIGYISLDRKDLAVVVQCDAIQSAYINLG